MPLIQRKTILKDFENYKLRYTMKYGFFYNVLYWFDLIIELLIFQMYIFIQLFIIDQVFKLK
jgi:hypothetical protein